MHELAIAQNIVDHVMKQRELHSYQKIEIIALRIGELTDIVPEALEFGFEASTRDTALEGTKLRIEHVSVRCRCDECSNEFTVQERIMFTCPKCDSYSVTILQGTELEITYLEVDDGKVNTAGNEPARSEEARIK